MADDVIIPDGFVVEGATPEALEVAAKTIEAFQQRAAAGSHLETEHIEQSGQSQSNSVKK